MNPLSNPQLSTLAAEYGTPLYVYDAENIKHQYNKLTHAFRNRDAKMFYACKSLTNLNILRYIKNPRRIIGLCKHKRSEAGAHGGFYKRKYFVYTKLRRL